MTNYNFGDIVLAAVPQTDLSGASKQRPACVLYDGGDLDFILARITSQIYTGETDYTISKWTEAGLLFESCIRLSKIATLEKTIIRRKLGSLDKADRVEVKKILRRMFK